MRVYFINLKLNIMNTINLIIGSICILFLIMNYTVIDKPDRSSNSFSILLLSAGIANIILGIYF